MPKFKKKVIRKQVGGDLPYYEEGPGLFRAFENIRKSASDSIVSPKEAADRAKRLGLAAAEPKVAPLKALSSGPSGGGMAREGIGGSIVKALQSNPASLSGYGLAESSIMKALGKPAPMKSESASSPASSTPASKGKPAVQPKAVVPVKRGPAVDAAMPIAPAASPDSYNREIEDLQAMLGSGGLQSDTPAAPDYKISAGASGNKGLDALRSMGID
jgi:hypothetical protein